jgi:thiol:disulfide interchange protein DsbA
MPTFGTGKAKVRIYTDYFCGPCDKLEPKLDPILARLVKKNIATVTFVDTPIHAPTPTYARYFLYIINEQNDFDHVLRMRAKLFDAARSNITQKEALEEYLAKNQVKFKQLDTVPIFAALNKYLKDDAIDSTPTVVIQEGQNKGVHKGAAEILKALEALK